MAALFYCRLNWLHESCQWLMVNCLHKSPLLILAKFLQLICTIKRNIFRKVWKETISKIYNTLVLPTFLCGSENWTLTASQRRRIERQKWSYWDLCQATPLRPQDKRLHTPGTTDYRHSRQDTWIQTELVSTLAKNATKPNPFEIVLLQTTKKENNWKTEETLERAVVTLETERIKGSNTWCLWWWWWWWW